VSRAESPPELRDADKWEVLGAASKALATIATQPLIVAKVGLQSRPPPARDGKPFKSFVEVMRYIIEQEGPLALFKGIAPQITKGILVQGLLMMTKERYAGSWSIEHNHTDHLPGWRYYSSCSSPTYARSGLKDWNRPHGFLRRKPTMFCRWKPPLIGQNRQYPRSSNEFKRSQGLMIHVYKCYFLLWRLNFSLCLPMKERITQKHAPICQGTEWVFCYRKHVKMYLLGNK